MKEQDRIYTHHRVGGKLEHCGVEILPNGKDIPLIYISRIDFHKSYKVSGNMQENVWVAHFADNPYTKLPWILNAGNRVRLIKEAKKIGLDYLEMIHNMPVRLTQEDTRDPVNGGMTKGLRVSKIPASIPPKDKLDQKHKSWDASKKYIKEGGSMVELEKRFEISEEVKKELMK